MSCEVAEAKHFHVGERQRCFRPGSKFGGHGGHSLRKTRPNFEIYLDGYNEICLKTKRPGLCQACGGRNFYLQPLLEAACISKVTRRGPVPQTVVHTYALDGELSEEPIEYSVHSLRSDSQNLRRIPLGSGLHLGCHKCGKNGMCSSKAKSSVRRKRFLEGAARNASSDAADMENFTSYTRPVESNSYLPSEAPIEAAFNIDDEVEEVQCRDLRTCCLSVLGGESLQCRDLDICRLGVLGLGVIFGDIGAWAIVTAQTPQAVFCLVSAAVRPTQP